MPRTDFSGHGLAAAAEQKHAPVFLFREREQLRDQVWHRDIFRQRIAENFRRPDDGFFLRHHEVGVEQNAAQLHVVQRRHQKIHAYGGGVMRLAGRDHFARERERFGQVDVVERHAKDGDGCAVNLGGWRGGLHETGRLLAARAEKSKP